ncbi:murI [Symbiodinium sp. CCMP2456]|nr:murI [Symbiodinium sp. CCMP2456]
MSSGSCLRRVYSSSQLYGGFPRKSPAIPWSAEPFSESSAFWPDDPSGDSLAPLLQRQFQKHSTRNQAPVTKVGMFDSGLGGMTVYKRLRQDFPTEVSFVADDGRAPYGPQPPADVADASREVLRFLKGALIACNTASIATIAYNVADEEEFAQLPILPIVPPYGSFFTALGHLGSCRKVGIFATDATCSSQAYQRKILSAAGFSIVPNRVDTEAFPLQAATTNCIGCAECVKAVQREAPFDKEATWEQDTEAMLRRKFASYFLDGVPVINFLIFGCTHFPILEPLVRKVFGEGVALIDPAVYQVKLAAELGISSSRKGEEFSVSAAPHSSKLATFRNAARAIELNYLDLRKPQNWTVVPLSNMGGRRLDILV